MYNNIEDYLISQDKNLEEKIFEWVKAGYNYVYIESSVDSRINSVESNLTYYPRMKFYENRRIYLELDDVREAFKNFDIDYKNMNYAELEDTIVKGWWS